MTLYNDKVLIHQASIVIVSICAPNYRAIIFMKQISILKTKGQLYNNICRLQYSLSIMDRLSRRKISKEIEDLNKTINQLDLIDIYRIIHLMVAEYTFFFRAHGKSPKLLYSGSQKIKIKNTDN